MKKNIIIDTLAITTFLSLVFGFYQETEAEKYQRLAGEVSQQLTDNERKAKEELNIAETEAERQRQIAEECARKK